MILHETLADDLIDTLAVNIEALRTQFKAHSGAPAVYVRLARRAEVIANDLAVLHGLLIAVHDEEAEEAAAVARAEEISRFVGLGGRRPFYPEPTDECWDGRDVL